MDKIRCNFAVEERNGRKNLAYMHARDIRGQTYSYAHQKPSNYQTKRGNDLASLEEELEDLGVISLPKEFSPNSKDGVEYAVQFMEMSALEREMSNLGVDLANEEGNWAVSAAKFQRQSLPPNHYVSRTI